MSARSFKTVKEKRGSIRKEKKFDAKYSPWLIGACIVGIIYFLFIEPDTVSGDFRYALFIFWMPVVLGMMLLAWFRRDFLATQYTTSKGFFLKAFVVGFYLIQGIFVSYISLGQIAKMGWDCVNVIVARREPFEMLRCDVTKFRNSGRRSSFAHVDFKLNGEHESFTVSDSFVNQYDGEDPKWYELHIEVQKGIWGCYLVNDWTIVKK